MQKKTNDSPKAALLPASGIGDGLLMTAVAPFFQARGMVSHIFHAKIHELSSWFPHISFHPQIEEQKLLSQLQSYDSVFVQNDNSPKIKTLHKAREEGSLRSLHIVYVTHNEKKHAPLHAQDYLCDLSKTILENLKCAASHSLLLENFLDTNALYPPPHLQKSRFPKRILLHPMSGSEHKNWSKQKFLLLARMLQEKGFEPVIAVSAQERCQWTDALVDKIALPHFSTLYDFASFLYESGGLIGNDSFAGHLASYFHLPTLIIAAKKKQMQLWQPGWKKAQLIFPPPWVPNVKGFRFLEKNWQLFISPKSVLKTFLDLICLGK